MADSYRLPNAVTSEEINLKKIRVVLVCEGIEVGPMGGKKDNSDVIVDFKEKSLCVTAQVRKKGSKGTKGTVNYRQHIKQLPGEIIPDQCTYKFKKDQIILELAKKEESSWAVQLSTRGLEQASSDESD